MKSKIISISAISSAFVAICLTLGAYFEAIDLFSLVIASMFVILPLYYNSYAGSILSVLVGGIIALMFSGFNFFSIIFPAFFGFFGFYPIFCIYFTKKPKKRIVKIILGLIWSVIAIYGMYFYYTFVMKITDLELPKFLMDNIYLLLLPIAICFYFLFDKFILVSKFTIDKYLRRIIK